MISLIFLYILLIKGVGGGGAVVWELLVPQILFMISANIYYNSNHVKDWAAVFLSDSAQLHPNAIYCLLAQQFAKKIVHSALKTLRLINFQDELSYIRIGM